MTKLSQTKWFRKREIPLSNQKHLERGALSVTKTVQLPIRVNCGSQRMYSSMRSIQNDLWLFLSFTVDDRGNTNISGLGICYHIISEELKH